MEPREKLATESISRRIIREVCNRLRNSDLRADDRDVTNALDAEFERLRALLAEPSPTPIPDIAIPISDALPQVEAALNGIAYSADESDSIDLAKSALALLPALAQQMEEGERAKIALVNLRARVFANRQVDGGDHSTACTIWGDNGQGGTKEGFTEPLPCNCGALRNFEKMKRAKAEAELTRTREALAVAEENLESAAISLASYDQSYGGGGGESEALDIARSLGFDGNSSECVEWLLDRCKLRAARIAALSPTGTPGAEGEPTV